MGIISLITSFVSINCHIHTYALLDKRCVLYSERITLKKYREIKFNVNRGWKTVCVQTWPTQWAFSIHSALPAAVTETKNPTANIFHGRMNDEWQTLTVLVTERTVLYDLKGNTGMSKGGHNSATKSWWWVFIINNISLLLDNSFKFSVIFGWITNLNILTVWWHFHHGWMSFFFLSTLDCNRCQLYLLWWQVCLHHLLWFV